MYLGIILLYMQYSVLGQRKCLERMKLFGVVKSRRLPSYPWIFFAAEIMLLGKSQNIANF